MIICGDTHGCFGKLNDVISRKTPDIIIVCGDFGFWPKFDDNKYKRYINLHGDGNENEAHHYATTNINYVDKIKPHNTKIYWCDGNHEHHDMIDRIKEENGHKKEPIEVRPNIFYCPRGTIVRLEDKTFLFMGGADSIDKNQRTIKLDWFPQEIISQKDVMDLPDPDQVNIDVVISHTCPDFLVSQMIPYCGLKYNDPSTKALEMIWEMYTPSRWYFGHWHHHKVMRERGTKFTALNCIPESNWWVTL